MVGQSHGGTSRKGGRVGRELRSENGSVEGDEDGVTGPGASHAVEKKSGVGRKARLQFSQHIWRLETGDCFYQVNIVQAATLIDKLEVSLYRLASRRNADGAASPDMGEG